MGCAKSKDQQSIDRPTGSLAKAKQAIPTLDKVEIPSDESSSK
jgi:hypothetical protein